MVLVAAAGCALAAGAGGLWLLESAILPREQPKHQRMLLAPMVGVIEPCVMLQEGSPSPVSRAPALVASCTGPQGSAAALLESTLTQLEPGNGAAAPYDLGYTLPVPLLQLFHREANDWAIDRQAVGRLVRTVRDSARPMILYLFSTHFAANAPIEEDLAKNPVNLAQTRDGPLATDTYYASKIYNWTFASTQTDITARRVQAIRAVLDEVCKLEPHDIAKIRGVTLLGELHHLFPNFQGGMGFETPYRVTDYSPPSVEGFRRFLQKEFGSIARLNRAVDGDFTSFEDVEPPSRDIRKEVLKRYTDHIDSFAQGMLPVSGWAFVDRPAALGPAWVHIYRNGEFIGKTPVTLSRQDVLQAKPQFGDANTGWRMDMDFTHLPTGLHRLDVFLEQTPGVLTPMGTRQIAIMDKQQRTPGLLPQKALPPSTPVVGELQAYLDSPADHSSYYYNPMVPLWHRFRARQVADYLHYFDTVVAQSCLATTPRYTHQIVPFTNPSWDANKFAIQASLQKMPPLRLGVSLYGEPTYGTSFSDWFARTKHQGYGVTEFHPLKAMDETAMRDMLRTHATRGAQFLSFFLEPYWQGELVERGHNIFSFGPENPQFGSASLYRAVQQVLTPTLSSGLAEPDRPQGNTSAIANATP